MSLASSGVEASPPLGVLIPKFWARDLDSYSNNFMSFPDDFHSGLAEYLAITPDIPQPIYYPWGHLMPSCRVGRQDQNPLDNHSVSRKRQNRRQLSGPTLAPTGL